MRELEALQKEIAQLKEQMVDREEMLERNQFTREEEQANYAKLI